MSKICLFRAPLYIIQGQLRYLQIPAGQWQVRPLPSHALSQSYIDDFLLSHKKRMCDDTFLISSYPSFLVATPNVWLLLVMVWSLCIIFIKLQHILDIIFINGLLAIGCTSDLYTQSNKRTCRSQIKTSSAHHFAIAYTSIEWRCAESVSFLIGLQSVPTFLTHLTAGLGSLVRAFRALYTFKRLYITYLISALFIKTSSSKLSSASLAERLDRTVVVPAILQSVFEFGMFYVILILLDIVPDDALSGYIVNHGLSKCITVFLRPFIYFSYRIFILTKAFHYKKCVNKIRNRTEIIYQAPITNLKNLDN
ncbi:hypothetical protein AGLY_004583 [Aphis glycines]|uniref:Uncharacterized protein n=1 Tax=Aphis glycines TaxID=307491 RepID=A0A6G0TUF4_APHGL|nr:hypothetical protein AGLY_004583 [Aphis glycines]